MLGSFSGSLGSSGSFSSIDSPLRERASTWSFVDVPPVIAENQAPSDAGTSGESGFHDMSRQASKTESSESAADTGQCDQALEEIIKQSAEYNESETSRSSSDTTITPEEQIVDDADHHTKSSASSETSHSSNVQSQGNVVSDNQSTQSHDNDSAESSVFDEPTNRADRKVYKGGKHVDDMSSKIVNYDTDFPPVLPSSSGAGRSDSVSDTVYCDHKINQTSDTNSENKDLRMSEALKDGNSKDGHTNLASKTVRDVIIEKTGVKSDTDKEVISEVYKSESDIIIKGKDDIAECIDEAVVEDIGDAQCDEVTHL